MSLYEIEISALGAPPRQMHLTDPDKAREIYRACSGHVLCHAAISKDGRELTPREMKKLLGRRRRG